MDYISVKQAAEKWRVHIRVVEQYCKGGRVLGAKKIGASWAIPSNSEKPKDPRQINKKNAQTLLPRQSPYQIMTDLYNTTGKADEIAQSLKKSPVAFSLFSSQLAYLRGDIDTAYELIITVPAENECFDSQIGRGLMLSLCAMYRGDTELWRKAKQYISDTPCANESESKALKFWLAAADSSIYSSVGFPDEFCRGCLDFLPNDSHAVANFFFAKYLYVSFSENLLQISISRDKVSNDHIYKILPSVCELLISKAKADRCIVVEIYLHLICAIAYHNKGENNYAVEHIDRAAEIAIPDGLISPFAEYRRPLDFLIDDCLSCKNSDFYNRIKKLSAQLDEGWVILHNYILERSVSNDLTTREREVAKLAVFGLTNSEISAQLHISVDTVKQALSGAMIKAGIKKRRELVRYI